MNPKTAAGQRLWADPKYGESATWEEWTEAILAIEREARAAPEHCCCCEDHCTRRPHDSRLD